MGIVTNYRVTAVHDVDNGGRMSVTQCPMDSRAYEVSDCDYSERGGYDTEFAPNRSARLARNKGGAAFGTTTLREPVQAISALSAAWGHFQVTEEPE